PSLLFSLSPSLPLSVSLHLSAPLWKPNRGQARRSEGLAGWLACLHASRWSALSKRRAEVWLPLISALSGRGVVVGVGALCSVLAPPPVLFLSLSLSLSLPHSLPLTHNRTTEHYCRISLC